MKSRYEWKDLAIILFFSKVALTNFLGYSGINKSLIAYGLLVAIYGCLGISVLRERGAIRFEGIAVIAATGAVFLYTIYAHPEYHTVLFEKSEWNIISNVFNFVSAPFAFYFIRCQTNLKQLNRDFLIVAYLNFFGNCLGFLKPMDSIGGEEYNMLFGYQISFPAILFLWYFFCHRDRWHYLFLSLLAIAEGVFFGSRGCVLGYACFVVLYMLLIEPGITKYKVATVAAAGVGAYVCTSPTIMLGFYQMLLKLGIHSRTLLRLALGEITDDNGRDRIYATLQRALEKIDLFHGYGAYGDRYLLRAEFYSHSILYELCITFGVVVGGILILLLAGSLLFIIWRYRKHPQLGLLLAFGSYSLCRLLFSGSFWYEQMFGAMVGLMVTFLTQKQNSFRWLTARAPKGNIIATLSQADYEALSEVVVDANDSAEEISITIKLQS